YTLDAVVVAEERQRPCLIGDADAGKAGGFGQGIDEAGAAAPRLHRQSAPEFEFAIDLEGLPPIDRRKADAFASHPLHRALAAVTRISHSSGSVRYSVRRPMSS